MASCMYCNELIKPAHATNIKNDHKICYLESLRRTTNGMCDYCGIEKGDVTFYCGKCEKKYQGYTGP